MRIPNIVLERVAKTEELGPAERAVYLFACAYEPATISELAAVSRMDRGGVARTCRNLTRLGWMKMVRWKGKVRPAPLIPHRCQAIMAENLEAEYDMQVNKGEYLVNKRMDWSLRSDEYVANARPKLLTSPQTDERLEYDRFDPRAMFGTEFNGDQHYNASQMSKEEEVRQQKTRDLLKESLSRRSGVTLLTLTAEDLMPGVLESKLDKTVPHLVRGYVDKEGPYFKALTNLCSNYAAKAARERARRANAGRKQTAGEAAGKRNY